MLTFDTNRVIEAQPTQILEVLNNELVRRGWEKIEIDPSTYSLTAQLFDNASSRDFYATTVTCVPLGEKTEILLSISTNNLESAKDRGIAIILNTAQRLAE